MCLQFCQLVLELQKNLQQFLKFYSLGNQGSGRIKDLLKKKKTQKKQQLWVTAGR